MSMTAEGPADAGITRVGSDPNEKMIRPANSAVPGAIITAAHAQ